MPSYNKGFVDVFMNAQPDNIGMLICFYHCFVRGLQYSLCLKNFRGKMNFKYHSIQFSHFQAKNLKNWKVKRVFKGHTSHIPNGQFEDKALPSVGIWYQTTFLPSGSIAVYVTTSGFLWIPSSSPSLLFFLY